MMKTKTMEYKHNKGEWGEKTSPELRLEAMEEEEAERERERENSRKRMETQRDEQASSSQAYTAEKKK